MWYDINKTLSYNCLFNFVVGPRGVGKTYACKHKAIRDFLRDGAQFVYLRRYDTEIKIGQISNFFNDVQGFDAYDFSVKGNTFLCDDEVMGYALCLSKATQYKSVPFPDVDLIIFDEFIIDQGMIRYLPNEVQTFCEMYSTIARLRDVRVMFLSNAITFTNPYFLYFGLEMPTGNKKVRRFGDILIEFVDNDEYSEAASSTRFGAIISGRKYGDYAINNTFLKDSNIFIENLCEGLQCRAILLVSDERFGLYTGRSKLWYISEKVDDTCNLVIALKQDQHEDNAILVQEGRARLVWNDIQQHYYKGTLRFDSIKAKNLIAPKLINLGR